MDKKEENKTKLIAYGMYCNFIREVQHFDNMQTHFRLLASTILLGSIAAIGFLFSIENINLPFEKTFAAFIVSLIGISSLYTLWHVDLKFYERLLVSNFAEAYRFEEIHKWLPKAHHNMIRASHKKDHPSNVAYFYIGCITTIILTIGLTASYDLYLVHNCKILSIISLISSVLVSIIIFIFMKKKTNKINDLLKEINYISE
ncbi:MAG: hypothetical protein WCT85_06325 [Parachlamydiales bacterium]|jgi:heme/copper-type cytochrome/quinol oxidase subunit 4